MFTHQHQTLTAEVRHCYCIVHAELKSLQISCGVCSFALVVLIKSASEKRDSDGYSNNFCAIIMVKIILYKLNSLSVQILALCIVKIT